MKTYLEAVDLVLARDMSKHEDLIVPPDMEDAAQRYESLHQEVQHSLQAQVLARSLIEMGVEQHIPLVLLLCVAFSHGVMVGVEMEKQDA